MTQPRRKTKTRSKAPRKRAARGPRLLPDQAIFGPAFFGEVLPDMVKRCPCPPDHQLACYLVLGDGAVLDVLQVLALTARYCVLVVVEGEGNDGVARTDDDVGYEAVPYELVVRASIRPIPPRAGFGFQLDRAPTAEVDEETLRAEGLPAPSARPRS